MSHSLSLLEQPHEQAIRTIVTSELEPGVSINDLLLGQYRVGPESNAVLPIFVDSTAYDKPDWPYHGSVNFRYKRVDLEHALGHLNLQFRLTSPFNTMDIVEQLQDILKLHFESTDFVVENVTYDTNNMTYVLKAAPSSLRWFGQVDVRISKY